MGSKAIKCKNGSDTYYFVPYFPIGSIYMSVTNINPSTIFGGTWERIKGKFLIAADDNTYTLGATGGNSTHNHTNSGTGSTTLTVNQIPAHTHTLNGHTHTYNKSNATSGSTTLTINQIPAHSHEIRATANPNTGGVGYRGTFNGKEGSGQSQYPTGGNTALTGGGQGHTHSISTTSTNTGAASGSTANSSAFNTGGTTQGGTNANTGSGTAHNNLQPYFTCYIWCRTS